MKTLNSLRILITRPAHQAKDLCQYIAQHGGIPIRFPTVAIVLIDPGEKIEKIRTADFIIFLSPNGVTTALPFCTTLLQHARARFKLLAVGPSTAQALADNHFVVDHLPSSEFNSEGLCALPILQRIQEKNILIFQGETGRTHLAETLTQRGAHIDTITTYQRICPSVLDLSPPQVDQVDILLGTSVTGIENLVTLLYPYWQSALFEKPLVVISPRIAQFAQQIGFVKKVLIADNASDQAILHCLFSYTEKSLWNPSRNKK
jgi:uroporphyrinogen-III synthase